MTTILLKIKNCFKKYTKNFKIFQKEREKIQEMKKKSVLLSRNQSATHIFSHNSRKEKSMFPARKFTSNWKYDAMHHEKKLQ